MNRYNHLARRLGLRAEPEDASLFTQITTLSGVLDGEAVRVERIHGGNLLTTRATLRPPAPFRFRLGPETWTTKLAHMLGRHDVAIGEPAFDAAYKVETGDVDALKRLLTPALRECLDTLLRAGWRFVVADEGVELISFPSTPADDTEAAVESQLRYTVQVLGVLRRAVHDAFGPR